MQHIALHVEQLIKICIFGLLALIVALPNAESKTNAAPTTVPSKAAQASQTVWIAEQQNEFIGNTKLYVANDAVKLVAQEGQVIMLAHGPSWKVVVYRPQEKIGFSQTFTTALSQKKYLQIFSPIRKSSKKLLIIRLICIFPANLKRISMTFLTV